MAEGLLRQLGGSAFEVHRAGSKPNGYVNELAIEAMRAIGVDISAHRSKSASEFEGQHFDTVITVCDSAAELCPVFPGARRIHWSIWDPGNASGAREEKLACLLPRPRRTRLPPPPIATIRLSRASRPVVLRYGHAGFAHTGPGQPQSVRGQAVPEIREVSTVRQESSFPRYGFFRVL